MFLGCEMRCVFEIYALEVHLMLEIDVKDVFHMLMLWTPLTGHVKQNIRLVALSS